jgi:NAD(P)H-dependent FMN reductase
MKKRSILILNGSIRGEAGNSGAVTTKAVALFNELDIASPVLTLAGPMPSIKEVYQQLEEVDGFFVITGVYWNSWSSVLQRFFEVATAFEQSPAFFGKPVACAVTMDSVGGADVAARLLYTLVNLGCWAPPCSTVVLSRVGQEAIAASAGTADDPNEDVWRLDDIGVMLENLVAAVRVPSAGWKSWPHISLKIDDGPWPASGPLDLQTPGFL